MIEYNFDFLVDENEEDVTQGTKGVGFSDLIVSVIFFSFNKVNKCLLQPIEDSAKTGTIKPNSSLGIS